jgi:hypothetical protein
MATAKLSDISTPTLPVLLDRRVIDFPLRRVGARRFSSLGDEIGYS